MRAASTVIITSTTTSMAADRKPGGALAAPSAIRKPNGVLVPWKKPEKPMGMLGGLAIAVGVAAIGLYMLDWHGHRCDSCGTTWKHLGAFNVGSPEAHSCPNCGTVQWFERRRRARVPLHTALSPAGRMAAFGSVGRAVVQEDLGRKVALFDLPTYNSNQEGTRCRTPSIIVTSPARP